MNFNKMGQGSLEYLLIIGVAILVAAVVIFTLIQAVSQGQNTSESNLSDYQKNSFLGKSQIVKSLGYDYAVATIDGVRYYVDVTKSSPVITTVKPADSDELNTYPVEIDLCTDAYCQ
ncbi:MAG: class III signal peptide-containing protein [Candidatus ainarchaeum sp.]|nr:class III signal peptide-containing protein [Candidatus ainarchaeum sp.]